MSTPSNKYIKYSGIAFQMIAIIALFAFIGSKLDQKYDSNYFTAISAFVGVIFAMVSIIYQVSKDNKR